MCTNNIIYRQIIYETRFHHWLLNFSDFDIYVGRPSDGITTEVGLGERVVLQLSEGLRGSNYQLYLDNYFTNFHLLDTLHSQQIYACGTTRTNTRGFPEGLKSVRMQRGEHQFLQRVLSWHIFEWTTNQLPCYQLSPRQMLHTFHTGSRRMEPEPLCNVLTR